MAGELKKLFGGEAISWLANSLHVAHPSFDAASFEAACCDGLEEMELKQRANHIARCMAQHLPQDFPKAAKIVAASLGPEVSPTGENGLSVLRYMAHDSFIEQFGLKHPVAAFLLQAEVTKRATCEFSIRAFLICYPEQTYAQMLQWARSDNAHHRRLASEGSRPRLPWAQHLRKFQDDPAPVIALLEMLKDDSELYVRRSVANSINDISKDWPDVAVELCQRWLIDADENRKWIVKHALRDLVKKGHAGALSLSGASAEPKIKVEGLVISPKKLKIGDKFSFSFTLVSTSKTSQSLLVDYVIDYRKANGKMAQKVFKLTRLHLAPAARVVLKASTSFKDMTTRKHHPGTHGLSLQVNGKRIDLAQFELGA